MKRMRTLIALLGFGIANAAAVQAQEPATKPAPVNRMSDLSKLNIVDVLEKMQTTATPADQEAPSPIQVVVAFLQLSPSQQQQFGELLQARQTAVVPLLAGIQQRAQQLEALLNSGGSPGDVGVLVIQIHGLQQQVAQVQQAFLANFAGMLEPNQQQRLQAVQIAAQLQPILPAFQTLSLF